MTRFSTLLRVGVVKTRMGTRRGGDGRFVSGTLLRVGVVKTSAVVELTMAARNGFSTLLRVGVVKTGLLRRRVPQRFQYPLCGSVSLRPRWASFRCPGASLRFSTLLRVGVVKTSPVEQSRGPAAVSVPSCGSVSLRPIAADGDAANKSVSVPSAGRCR